MSISKVFKTKVAAPLLLGTALATTGCASLENPQTRGTTLGAAIGAGAGMIAADGKSRNTQNAAALIGGALGAAAGSAFNKDCVDETNTTLRRTINGEDASQWRGDQVYTQNCANSGNQSDSNLNLPSHIRPVR